MMNKSTYINYLPEIYRESDFAGRYLSIFEKVLTGIEEVLDRVSEYFDARTAPVEFLDWLAGWVALELRPQWSEEVKRRLIENIVPLYRKRGTLDGIREFLNIYTRAPVEIDEFSDPFRLGNPLWSVLGRTTILGGGPPGFFRVTVAIEPGDEARKIETEKNIRAIIDLEKPVHTYYDLNIAVKDE